MKFGATLIWLLCDSRRCSDWVGKTVPEEKLLLKLGRISVYIAIVTSIDRGTPKTPGTYLAGCTLARRGRKPRGCFLLAACSFVFGSICGAINYALG